MGFDRSIPMVGFHTRIADKKSVPALVRLLEEGLAPRGVNTLILEFNPGYAYACFPEYATGTFDAADAAVVRAACERLGIRPVPLFQCLSHQSNFSAVPWPLFQAHPELLETPDVPADATWPDFYCHSWCASNDAIWQYVFPMIDELAGAFGAEAVHIGIDEVFDIGEDGCARCRGRNKAKLLARTVRTLHDHLAEKGLDTMMWGDRLLDAEKMGYHMWEADRFGMHPALTLRDPETGEPVIPRDVILTDWHYDVHDHGYPSVACFLQEGFFTVPSVAANLAQVKGFWTAALDALYLGRKQQWPGKLGGILFTHWNPLTEAMVDDMLMGMRGGAVEHSDPYGAGPTGEVIGAMAEKAGKMRKVY